MNILINARLILPDETGHFKVTHGTLLFDHLIRAIFPDPLGDNRLSDSGGPFKAAVRSDERASLTTSATIGKFFETWVGGREVEEKFSQHDSNESSTTRHPRTSEPPNSQPSIIDAQGLFVSPGFINLHIHGCNGADTMDATPSALLTMQKFLPLTGVTAFLPTTMTMPLGAIRAALENVRGIRDKGQGIRDKGQGTRDIPLSNSRASVTRAPATADSMEGIQGAPALCYFLAGEKVDRPTHPQEEKSFSEPATQQTAEPLVTPRKIFSQSGRADEPTLGDQLRRVAGGWVGPQKDNTDNFPTPGPKLTLTENPVTPHSAFRIPHSALARVLGANVEGPYISRAYKGAQAESCIREPSFEEFIADYADVIKVVTVAPEVAGGLELIEKCRERGIVASIGHSAADYETALEAIKEHGASHITHLFNAQSGLHHRKPGIVGAALDTDVTVELISDNVHVHPMLQRLIWRTKEHSQIILVTDSLKACGLGDGFYELGGQQVEVRGEVARLKDGTIAASVGTLNRMLAKFRENVGASVAEVVELVTKNPAQKLGLYERLGSLEVGKVADLVLFDDAFNIAQTIVQGVGL